ncbi:MAG: sulfotransferase family 2 domain-containing protein [Bacteroidales bacterium]
MAIISHKNRFIFIHIPKTAGTAINWALQEKSNVSFRKFYGKLKYIYYSLVSPNMCFTLYTPKIQKHAKAKEIRSVIPKQIWKEYFTFAFVRNPWDLMVSSYEWWLQMAGMWPDLHDDIQKIKKMKGFHEFIWSEYGLSRINEQYGNIYDWISEGDDEIIVDYVGKYENLDKDLNWIGSHLGISEVVPPKINVTERLPYREYYDEESKKLVGERFEKTIEKFEYSF